ncbi:TIGR02680 family protein [Actinophytocola gossypii]|uniref:TIGR02680 family protein n=1 Tax=Actinophytocola gossypii TaxID=2812003 RepID=A0ABT2J8U7_9PSEU|nr:TIGR02680 family protein [Actinophytocola gossypii]MCT2584294.1 TIGR02680 family protein [Actinophytocola gossypii]
MRWQLHRGGIVNVWQYSVETFDLSGGRVIFQGTNGSGKSRTLELLLPLCLDGDLHQIGSKGYDTVSMRRLMLDDYTGGPNRIGYAWIELRREVDGRPEYLTSGIGIKASATSQQINDSWRFVTDRRVGRDFELVADGTPVGATQLRDLIGADCLHDEEPFRARISELVYGIPATRYADLLHLQRTLRNPDVGLKVLEGQLEQILSDSLPPLDPAVVERLASSFEDLESIRDNIRGLAAADAALGRFLTGYAGYAYGSLRTTGKRAADATRELGSARAEIERLVTRLRDEEAAAEKSETEVAQLEERETTLEGRIDDLKTSPLYDSVRDLADRKRVVQAARSAAVSALRQLRTQREHTEQLVDSVLAELDRYRDDTAQAVDLAVTIAERMREAGLDPRLTPTVPQAPYGEATEVHETGRATLDPDAAPTELTRRLPPTLDPDALRAALAEAGEQASRAASALAERCAVTLSLLERATELETERTELGRRQQEARAAQLNATEAAGRRNEAAQHLDDVAHTWFDAVTRWTADIPEDAPELAPPPVAELVADQDASGRATERAHAWLRGRLPALHAEVGRTKHLVDDLDKRIAVATEELTALRSGVDTHPERPAFATAERDPASGAAFYRLVDFASDVDDPARAGCEAALESSGLLTAWVTADGTLADPARPDLTAVVAGDAASGPSLADVLVPAVPPDSPVSPEVVGRLLDRIALGASATGLAVSTDGSWRAGVLAGASAKPAAEFVGAGARESARHRRIEELVATVDRLTGERDEAVAALATAREQAASWERHIDAYPDDRALLTAHVTVRGAADAADDAAGRALAARDGHGAAADRHRSRQDELVADARTAGLDASPESLRQARTSALDARSAADALVTALTRRCAGAVDTLAKAVANHARAAEELAEVAAGAERACLDHANESTGYDERVRAIGGAAEQLERDLASAEEERTGVRQRLPGARQQATEARVKAGKTQTQIDTREARLAELVERESAARRRFRDALGADGVWAAAVDAPRPDDDEAAFAALTSAPRDPVSEDAVLNNLQALQTALAGSHDIVAQRSADILTVTVTGAHGPQPVAEAARDVATRLATQRDLLSEEYQSVFDAFMLRDLADKLATQIAVADDLCRRMNDTLDVARSSQGVHVRLEWQPAPDLDEEMRHALTLVRTPFADRGQGEDERLRQALTDRITAERDGHSGDYAEVLGRALDYRSWYRFTVRVRDDGPDGAPRTRRMRQLSSGETRLISYVTLFAAASAFYDAVSAGAERPPVRLVLLDEAFERLDEPTIARMLGLLVDLDMDWIITWPSGWGLSEKIPRMHIYDVLRPKGGRGIACTHAIWTGNALTEDR